ncbi:RDD family protein [Hydrocarboniphaga sp.]|uniref:RDD family protein n=1 Tax=Hydrocarboniphaga sp. TaxID=2033016 RepID=UPI002613599A|nr:RDD family protein [Hydrocarboniphaga sp.]
MPLVLPAPIWRRLAASIYDGLLLLAMWMVAALVDTLVRDALGGAARTRLAFQILLFLVGLGFFGYSWTHGGQTLGMRVWRMRVRRIDGSALRWPTAGVRYAVMLLTWFALFLPGLLQFPTLAAHVHAGPVIVAGVAFSVVALLVMLLDARRRALCDWAAMTEVVVEPKDS